MTPVYDDGQATVYQGDALTVLQELPSESVQCCVTSPPYWGLRDYGADGQIGLEETPEAYVARLVEVFREVRRVLRDDGTLWLNLGDSYANPYGSPRQGETGDRATRTFTPVLAPKKAANLKPKDLAGIPWMVAFALRADGWYLRQDVIWHKPNAMPESVTDRPTSAHEHLFLLSKRERYYYNADAIREPMVKGDANTGAKNYRIVNGIAYRDDSTQGHENHPLGRNKRSVWSIPTTPYAGAHFAVFPPKLIEPCILAGTSEHGACADCGTPWRRVVERDVTGAKECPKDEGRRAQGLQSSKSGLHSQYRHVTQTNKGWEPDCTCGTTAGQPCIVLDPFAGSGTTLATAKRLGRQAIGIELNAAYIRDHIVPRCRQQAMFLEAIG